LKMDAYFACSGMTVPSPIALRYWSNRTAAICSSSGSDPPYQGNQKVSALLRQFALDSTRDHPWASEASRRARIGFLAATLVVQSSNDRSRPGAALRSPALQTHKTHKRHREEFTFCSRHLEGSHARLCYS
jgi:hypothetical protein